MMQAEQRLGTENDEHEETVHFNYVLLTPAVELFVTSQCYYTESPFQRHGRSIS
jgi:hypothetical protein